MHRPFTGEPTQLRLRGFFQHHVCVGAAPAKGAHAGIRGRILRRRPWLQRRRHAQLERGGPGKTASEDTDPGDATAVAALKDLGKQTISGHGDGQASVAHRESVKHADTTDDAPRNNCKCEERSAKRTSRRGPRTG